MTTRKSKKKLLINCSFKRNTKLLSPESLGPNGPNPKQDERDRITNALQVARSKAEKNDRPSGTGSEDEEAKGSCK